MCFLYSRELSRKVLIGDTKMKSNAKNILVGVLSLAFYHFVLHLMLMWEYNEKYAIIQNILLFVLPSLPGVALAFLLIRNSVKEFFKSWGVCFLASLCMFIIWIALRVDLMIYSSLTGFEEFALGEGLLMAVMSFSYIVSCTIGSIIAAIVSWHKQKKSCI